MPKGDMTAAQYRARYAWLGILLDVHETENTTQASITFPLRTYSEQNVSRDWRVVHRRRKKQHQQTYDVLNYHLSAIYVLRRSPLP
jgi:hypothetical protein